MPDKFSATWISHSSLRDFTQCQRSYYLKNVYKNPKTRRKMQIASPSLSLGQAVHGVLESLSLLPLQERFSKSLIARLNELWPKYSGAIGGFSSNNQEKLFKERAEVMLRRVERNPGPLNRLAIKIKVKNDLPYYWISPEDELILCGKIDWLEYLPEEDAVRIVDFKTGKGREDENSLQLPIYHLLVDKLQHKKVLDASYWYLEQSDDPVIKQLPDLIEAHDRVMSLAKKIILARKLNHFPCSNGKNGCRYCLPFEAVLRNEAKYLGVSDYRDVYSLDEKKDDESEFEVELF